MVNQFFGDNQIYLDENDRKPEKKFNNEKILNSPTS